MTRPDTLPDLRPQLAAAQEWVASIIDGIRPDQLDASTPCDDYDVRALLEHLFAVVERVERVGKNGDVGDAPMQIALPDNDVAGAFREAAARSRTPWDDDARLSAIVSPPFGTMPGAAAIGAYLSEHINHGWDLATATGQPSEAEPQLAGIALQAMQQALPAEPRGGDIPFGPVVPSADDAGPTEQLANWTGRTSR